MADCLFEADTIAARVAELGAEIRRRYPGTHLTLLGVLKGSALFLADLVRAVGEPSELTFVQARSYGDRTESSGTVEVGEFEEEVIRGRVVIVADTILDTGRTLSTVKAHVQALGAEETVTCVLLDKPARRDLDITADLVGFEVPDRFLVGYGLDHGGRYRALPYIAILQDG